MVNCRKILEMANQWLETFLFPEKQDIEKGYFPVDWEKVDKELQKKNVTLTYCIMSMRQKHVRVERFPMLSDFFCENYGKYAKKYKLTMPIRRKKGEPIEVDWAGTTLQIMENHEQK